jgi:hypothetical protein
LRRTEHVFALGFTDLPIALLRGQHREAALDRRTCHHLVVPAFDGRVVAEIDAAALGKTRARLRGGGSTGR